MKTSSQKHPNLSEIKKAVFTGYIPFKDHLIECEECNDIYRTLKVISVSRNFSIENPGPEAIRRFHSVRLLDSNKDFSLIKSGLIQFDSWAGTPQHQIRNLEPGLIRRLCLKADEIAFDLVCERIQKGWAFTGRIYESGDAVMHWVLQVGNKKILPKSLGYYHWMSNQGPRTIKLFSAETQLDFEKVAW